MATFIESTKLVDDQKKASGKRRRGGEVSTVRDDLVVVRKGDKSRVSE